VKKGWWNGELVNLLERVVLDASTLTDDNLKTMTRA
jgi:hypothetical protein